MHSAERVQSPPKPLRIPEQPSEHAPRGLCHLLLPSPRTLDPALPGLRLNTAGVGPARRLPADIRSSSIDYMVSVKKAAVGKLLGCGDAK